MKHDGQQLSQQHIRKEKQRFYIRQAIFWGYHFLILLIVVLLITYSTKIKISFSDFSNSNQYKHGLQTINFWQMSYIIDIRIVSTMNCPQGYEYLINYNWTGTMQGCKCQFVVNNYYQIFVTQGACNLNQIKYGCRDIPSQSAQRMSFWKGSKLLCVKRIKNLNFYNSTFKTSTICSQDTNYQISFLNNISCPITNISNTSMWANQKQYILDPINNYSLFSINNGGYPIAALKISEYSFCPFFDTQNISPNKTGNYILAQNQILNCNGTDPRIVTFDSINQSTFYQNNINIKKTTSILPGYPNPSTQYIYLLGYIPYPTWTYKCRISNNLNLNTVTSHLLFNYENKSNIQAFYVTLIISLVLVVIRIFYIVRRIRQLKIKKLYGKIYQSEQQLCKKLPNLNLIKKLKNQLIMMLIDIGLRLGLLIFFIVSIVTYSNYFQWYISAVSCTDNFLAVTILQYSNEITKIYYYIVYLLVMILILIFFDILYTIFRFKSGELILKKNEITIEKSQDESKKMMSEIDNEKFNTQQKSLQVLDIGDQLGNDKKFGQTNTNFNLFMQQEIKVNKKKKKVLKRKKQFRRDQQQQL